MDIWLIRNGEKYGPFPDYDVRRRIDRGEFDPQAPAWHEGLAEWIPLSEIEIFKSGFAPVPKPVEAAPVQAAAPPPLPSQTKYFRRFWARWLDINLYVGVWWLLLWAGGRNLEEIFFNQWIMLSQLVPWCIIEILLIHWIATTPGKWLLGLRVVNADGSNLDLTESTRRAFRVYVLGIGFGWSIVSIFCQGVSTWTTKRLGVPLWDHLGKHRMSYQPFAVWKIILLVVLFFIAVLTQMTITFPYHQKLMAQEMPELKALLDKNREQLQQARPK